MRSISEATNLLASAPYLWQLRLRSLELCKQLELELLKLSDAVVPLSCVFAVGSVGRLEIGEASDLDGVVVLQDQAFDPNDVENTMLKLEKIYGKLGFQIAKASGIYRQPVTQIELLDIERRGSLDECPDVYGKRIQMLLDSRPLLNPDNFVSLQEQVLDWFLPKMGAQESYAFIINELQRYFHSYASWQMLKFERTANDGWYLRQAKLRITRVTTIGAMMFLIATTMHTGRHSVIKESLVLTPIERLIFVFECYGESEMRTRLIERYEFALRVMLDVDSREELIQTSPRSIDEVSQAMPPSYRKLYDASEEIMGLLTQFALNRSGDWPQKFYRNWMF